MGRSILEPATRLAVRAAYDVVVVGGGIAGVAAALAAAREGVSVALLEKQFAVGGLATLGNVIEYLPLCDGMGRQVSAGLAETLLKLSVCDGSAARAPGGVGIPQCWQGKGTLEERTRSRYRTAFNPATYALALERLLLRRGVELLYDTRFAAVRKQRDRVTHVICEDKGGRFALACKVVVDASGDADVCLAAGEQVDSSDVNIACGWFYYTDSCGKLALSKFSRSYDFGATMLPKGEKCGYSTADGRAVTAMVLHSNRLVEERLAELRETNKDRGLDLVRPSLIPSYRATRRLRGLYELCAADDRRWFDDTVGMIGHWRIRGPVYCLPLRSLCAARTANLAVAGRCMSTARDAWDATRVIPACAVSGEAAGAAASLLVTSDAHRLGALDVPALQQRLRRRGALINRRLLAGKTAEVDVAGLRAEGLQ